MHRFLLDVESPGSPAIVVAARPFVKPNSSLSHTARRIANAAHCFTQMITAFAPPSQLAPIVPSMRVLAPPAQ
jgi:hypothetical protein